MMPAIRKATVEDATRIAEINVYGWRMAYADVMSEQYLYGRLSVVKKALSIERALEGYYVFEENGVIKGYCLLGKTDTPNACELVALYVEPAYKRNGIGHQFMNFIKAYCVAHTLRTVQLWVLEANTPARSFYEKNGFALTGESVWLESLQLTELRYQLDL